MHEDSLLASELEPQRRGVADHDARGSSVLDEGLGLGDEEAQLVDGAPRDEVLEAVARRPGKLRLRLVQRSVDTLGELLAGAARGADSRPNDLAHPPLLPLARLHDLEKLELLLAPGQDERLELGGLVLLEHELLVSGVLQLELEPRGNGLASDLVPVHPLRLEPSLEPRHHPLERPDLGGHTSHMMRKALALVLDSAQALRCPRAQGSKAILAKPRPRHELEKSRLEHLPLGDGESQPVPLLLELSFHGTRQLLDSEHRLGLAGQLPGSQDLQFRLHRRISAQDRSRSRLVVRLVGRAAPTRRPA